MHRYVRKLCEQAFEIAETYNVKGSIVAVDVGGHPIVILRADHAGFATLEAARKKAVASAALQMSTHAMVEMFGADPLAVAALQASGDMLVVPGGFPITFCDGCIGGLGIAGGHYREDHIIGEKAFRALSTQTTSDAGPRPQVAQ